MLGTETEFHVEILGMNHEGQGIAKKDGLTIFVEGGIIGEVVSVEIVQLKKTYAVARVKSLLRPSHERALPFCPVYERCGGCQLQHMTYRESLRFKQKVVKDALQRIGKLKHTVVNPTLGMEDPFKYRNKAQFPYGVRNALPISGLYAKKSHEIVEFLECPIQMEQNDRVKRLVEGLVHEYRVSAYDETHGRGVLRHLCVRTALHTGEVMVVFVVTQKDDKNLSFVIDDLVRALPMVKSVYVNVNSKKTNVILGHENILVYGKEKIVDVLGGFQFEISPNSFYQVNPKQTEVLYKKALDYAKLTGKETVFDLYSGIGTISLFLSQKAKNVIGVEVVSAAVQDANRNKEINNVENVAFIEGEAEIVVPKLFSKGQRADVVVVDPPRKGCDEKLLHTMLQMNPQRMVYISCNPSTLARDLAYLEGGGYSAIEVQPVDMFPWTRHVETCSLLVRNELRDAVRMP